GLHTAIVDENAVGFINDRGVKAAQNEIFGAIFRVVKKLANEAAGWIADNADLQAVAEKIGDHFLAGGVSDIAIVSVAAFFGRHFADDETDANAAHVVKRRQPFGVALHEIIVDGDDVAGLMRPT